MATWYWTGAGVLALLAIAIPVLLIIEGQHLEAVIVGLPSLIVLGVVLALTSGISRDG